MARTNMTATRVKPAVDHLLTLRVLRRERISPSFARVTLGGGDIEAFRPMGFDQWFRLFLPVSEQSLSRLPNKLDTLAYLRFLAIAKTDRPVLRNYTVRAFRPDGVDGPEIDVDFVLHGSGAHSGPAATWADACAPGDAVAILDEGISYHPPADLGRRTILVADETGLPAAAAILTSLDRDVTGTAIIEVPHADDAQQVDAPDGVEVRWVVRPSATDVPGVAALAAARELAVPTDPFFGWVVGEQSLPTTLRRQWVQAGAPKNAISFCGYWKAGAHR
jgi:NADPH-dependent ferric siderophore reductase